MRPEGELVLRLAVDLLALAQLLGRLAERDGPLRPHLLVDQSPAQCRRHQGGVARRDRAARSWAAPKEHGSSTRPRRRARRRPHRARSVGTPTIAASRLGPAEPVHGPGRDRGGTARPADRHPGHVSVVLTGAVGVAEDDLVDRGPGRGRARARREFATTSAPRSSGRTPGERAAVAAERSPDRVVQEHVVGHHAPPELGRLEGIS